MPHISTIQVEKLMKRCQIGVGGKNALDTAHEIMAECYGTLGALASERDQLITDARRALDAWDTTTLNRAADGRLQSCMDELGVSAAGARRT